MNAKICKSQFSSPFLLNMSPLKDNEKENWEVAYNSIFKIQTYHSNVSILRNMSPNNQGIRKCLQFCSGSDIDCQIVH